MNYKKGDILICKKRFPIRYRFVEVGERCTIISIWHNSNNLNYEYYGEYVFDVEIDKNKLHTRLNDRIITENFESITEHRNRIISEL